MKKDVVSILGSVQEMTSSMSDGINVPIPNDVNVEELTKGDDNPMFVTIEAVHEGTSKNKRHYDRSVIMEIARQVKSKRPDAYLGHLSDSERTTKRPDPQTIWLGSVVKEMDGKLRLFVKGYVLPYADKLRSYLKKAKASGKKVAVSVYGQAKQVWNDSLSAYEMSQFNLESIDWARSGSEGLTPTTDFSLTAEMRNQPSNREDIISEMTLGELKAFNPSVAKALEDEIKVKTVTEMDEEKQDELSTIHEMVGENPVDAIRSLQKTVAEQIIENSVKEKVKNKEAKKLIKGMIVKEMDSYTPEEAKAKTKEVLRSPEIQGIIKETTGNKTINSYRDNRKKGHGRRFTTVD